MSKVVTTYRDYAALPDDGKRYELYEGELVEMPSPTLRHQRAIGNLYTILRDHVTRHGLGEVLLAPFDVILSDITVFQPDILYVDRSRGSVLAEHGVEGAPTLAIEVLSPSTAARDRGRKRALYARHGVSYLWLVDPVAGAIDAYLLEGNDYRLSARVAGEVTARLPPFLDLLLSPASLFA
jgi:Uma2 family endonuclease